MSSLQRQTTTNPPNQVERTRNRRALVPRADIYETPESIVLMAEMPGVAEDSVNIILENDLLTIEGNGADEARAGFALAYAEYEIGDYRRAFTLSTQVDRDKIVATVKDGVLTLVLPKAEPAKARKITVRAG